MSRLQAIYQPGLNIWEVVEFFYFGNHLIGRVLHRVATHKLAQELIGLIQG